MNSLRICVKLKNLLTGISSPCNSIGDAPFKFSFSWLLRPANIVGKPRLIKFIQQTSGWGLAKTKLQSLSLLFILAIVSPYCNGANNNSNTPPTHTSAIDTNINQPINTDQKTMAATDVKNNPSSDQIGTPLSKMIGTSQLIVYGSIKKVLDSTILVQVIKKIAGEEIEMVIEVIKAKPDPFASIRPAPYKAGQCFLFFLINPGNTSTKKTWKLAGNTIGNEAELPVIDKYIFFIDRYFEGLPQKEYNVNGVQQNIQRFEFPQFLDAIEGYQQCYKWTQQNNTNRMLPEKSCSDEQAVTYAKKSFIHQYLVTETQHFISNK
ncbi:MAG: hypothetical protein ABIN94_13250 [Ferruginibacter sp.]